MHRTILALLAALALGVFLGSRLAQARPGDDFTLEQHDRIVAEAPGCYASCQAMGTVRHCTLREPECRAVCITLPECKPDGFKPIRVCSVVRERS
jgi:hypothetical protein